MKIFKKTGLALLGVFILIQFFPPVRNHNEKLLPANIAIMYKVPENVQAILKNSCYDCHSNSTNYPWYSRVQPFGWLLANHIKNGKAMLNFSEFGAYPLRRQISKLKGIENSIKDGTMPLWSYTLIHRNAILSTNNKAVLNQWLDKTTDSLSLKDE